MSRDTGGLSHAEGEASEPYRKNEYHIDPTGCAVNFVEYLSDLPTEHNLSV